MKHVLHIGVLLLLIVPTAVGQQSYEAVELEVLKKYQTYVAHQYEYEERETLLTDFREALYTMLEREDLKSYAFPQLEKDMVVTTSGDGVLTLISWDWHNNGTHHIYESVARYVTKDRIIVYPLHQVSDPKHGYDEAYYYRIEPLPDHAYLVFGYGTHGGGNHFFNLRKLEVTASGIADCITCFDGDSRLVVEQPRYEDIPPQFDAKTSTIEYLEYKEEETQGFLVPTGTTQKLIYEDGAFKAQHEI